MNPDYLRGRMDELDLQIEEENDPTCSLRLIRERLDVLNMLLSLKYGEEKAKSV